MQCSFAVNELFQHQWRHSKGECHLLSLTIAKSICIWTYKCANLTIFTIFHLKILEKYATSNIEIHTFNQVLICRYLLNLFPSVLLNETLFCFLLLLLLLVSEQVPTFSCRRFPAVTLQRVYWEGWLVCWKKKETTLLWSIVLLSFIKLNLQYFPELQQLPKYCKY